MKMPRTPPAWEESAFELFRQPDFRAHMATISAVYPDRYFHWDEVRCRPVPSSFPPREHWWAYLKLKRMSQSREVPLQDKKGNSFRYCLVDPIPELLHELDQSCSGHFQLPGQVQQAEGRERYTISSFMEEAIRSSQIEGAVETRKIAKEMLRVGRAARNKSEQMILNNYHAMQCIKEWKKESFTPEMLFELHRILTVDTMPEEQIGRFRRDEERVEISDEYGEVFHIPPGASLLGDRVSKMCRFANGATDGQFVHPVLRAIILHFWLAFDHPFLDGNGRCARALFYWGMLKENYWLAEFISISEIIYRAPVKYYRAFLYTETDDNDLTYFILYHLQVIRKAVGELHEYIDRKTKEIQELEKQLRLAKNVNHRQRALLSNALRHPDRQYTFESHQRCHGISYQTARTDLMALNDMGFLNADKAGRTWYFSPAQNLGHRLNEADS